MLSPPLAPSLRLAFRSAALSVALLTAPLVAPRDATAQSATRTPAQDSAYAVVTKLFDAMRGRDTAAMREAFVPNAAMQSLRRDSVRFESIDGWIASVGRAPAGLVLDERLANPVIHVDGDLADIWVDYWFFAGDRFSHCGVDAILLARQSGRWRIFSVVDTRRTADCPPAPPR